MRDGFVPVTRVSELSPGEMKWWPSIASGCSSRTSTAPSARSRTPAVTGRRPCRRDVAGHVVECPLHFARFDVRTGKLLSGPVAADVPTYEVLIEDDTVYVKR